MVHKKSFKDIPVSQINALLRMEYDNLSREEVATKGYNKILDRVSLLLEMKKRAK